MAGVGVSLAEPSADLSKFMLAAQRFGSLADQLQSGLEIAEAEGKALVAGAHAKRGEVDAAERRAAALRELLGAYGQPEELKLVPMPVLESPARPAREPERINALSALAASLGGAGVVAEYLRGVQAGTEAEYQRALDEWRSMVREAAVRNEQAMRLRDELQRLNAANADRKDKWTLGRLELMQRIADAEADASEKRAAAQAALSAAEAQSRQIAAKAGLEGSRAIGSLYDKLLDSVLDAELERIRGEEARKTERERAGGRQTLEGIKTEGRLSVEALRGRSRLELQRARDHAANVRAQWANDARLKAAQVRAGSSVKAAQIRAGGAAGQGPKESPEERRMRLENATRDERRRYDLLAAELKDLYSLRRLPDETLVQYYRGGRAALEQEIRDTERDLSTIARSIQYISDQMRREMYGPSAAGANGRGAAVANPFGPGFSVVPMLGGQPASGFSYVPYGTGGPLPAPLKPAPTKPAPSKPAAKAAPRKAAPKSAPTKRYNPATGRLENVR